MASSGHLDVKAEIAKVKAEIESAKAKLAKAESEGDKELIVSYNSRLTGLEAQLTVLLKQASGKFGSILCFHFLFYY